MNDKEEVRVVIHTLRELLPDWIKGEAERESWAEEIATLEKYIGDPESEYHLPWTLRNPNLSPKQRQRELEQIQKSRKKRLAELREQQRHHEEIAAKLYPAVRMLCRFAHPVGIDTDPLRRLFDLGELEAGKEVPLVLLRIADASATSGKKQDEASLLDRVLAVLTPQQGRLMEYLWSKKTASYDTLRTLPRAWNDEPSDEAITKKLKDIRTRLDANNLSVVSVRISEASHRVNLDRPPD